MKTNAKCQARNELDRLLKKDDDLILRDHIREMQKLYSLFFTEACHSCESKQRAYLQRLRELKEKGIIKKIKTHQMRKFTLQKGFLIRFNGTSEAFSDENLTDEIAIAFLKINPNGISCFSRYPSHWEEIIKQEKGKDKKKQEDSSPIIDHENPSTSKPISDHHRLSLINLKDSSPKISRNKKIKEALQRKLKK